VRGDAALERDTIALLPFASHGFTPAIQSAMGFGQIAITL